MFSILILICAHHTFSVRRSWLGWRIIKRANGQSGWISSKKHSSKVAWGSSYRTEGRAAGVKERFVWRSVSRPTLYICLTSITDDSTASISDSVPPPVSSTASTSKKSSVNVILRSGEDLQWDQKIHLVGRCVKDPAMHICESCSLPVLIYGRMVSPG